MRQLETLDTLAYCTLLFMHLECPKQLFKILQVLHWGQYYHFVVVKIFFNLCITDTKYTGIIVSSRNVDSAVF